MSSTDYKPRFSFEVSWEQKERADRLLVTYGLRRAMFGVILDDVLDMIEEFGGVAIGVIMSGKVKPRDVIPSMKQADEVGKK